VVSVAEAQQTTDNHSDERFFFVGGGDIGAQGQEVALPCRIEQRCVACVDGRATAEEANIACDLVDHSAVLADGQQGEQKNQGAEDNGQSLADAESDEPEASGQGTPSAKI